VNSTIRTVGNVIVLDLYEHPSPRTEKPCLHSEVERLLTEGALRILINMENVPYVDSMGLGDLLAAKKAALMAGAELKLLRPRKRVYGLLAQANLSKIFEIFEDEQAAIRSFRA